MLRINGNDVTSIHADGLDAIAAYVNGQEAWSLSTGPIIGPLNVTDTFNRSDAPTLGSKYDFPRAAYTMEIMSGRAQAVTGSTYTPAVRNDIAFDGDNHRVSVVVGGVNSNNLFMPTVRANADQFVWVYCNTGSNPSIYTSYPTTPYVYTSGQSSRASGAAIGYVVGDVLSLEAVGQFYIFRKNGQGWTIWNDATGAYAPYTNASHRDCVLTLYRNSTQRGANSAKWEDLGNDAFFASRMTKSGTQAWTTAGPTTITGWSAVNTAVSGAPEYTSTTTSNGLFAIGNKTGATISAAVPFTGSGVDRSHTIRIVRVSDSLVVATSAPVVGESGTCTVSVERDVISGESYRVEMLSDGSSAGTITASTPTLTIS